MFEEINSATIDGIIAFEKASGCDVKITGAIGTGHSSGTQSLWNGSKLDIIPQCLRQR